MIYRTNLLMDRLPHYLASVVILGVVLYAVLTPNPPSTSLFAFPFADKIVHFLMFGGLSATIMWDYGRKTGKAGVKELLIIGFCCGLFGFLTEWMQDVEGAGRSADWRDGVADMAGAFLVPLAFRSVIRSHTLHRRLRLTPGDNLPGDKERALYEGSFPDDERREWDALMKICHTRKGKFRTTNVMSKGVFAGLIYWWDFGNFAYVEHFAIDSRCRNGGIGGRALDLFVEQFTDKGIVLEVEPETDGDMARRRIGFYRRHGFEVIEGFSYMQPPYSKEKNEIELWLMTYGHCPDAGIMSDTLKKEVYGAI